jgi:type I restriction enzyme S subunit
MSGDSTEYKFRDVATAVKGKLPRDKNESGLGLPYLTANYLRTNKADFWVKDHEGAVIAEDGDCLILWDGAGAGDLFTAKRGVVSSTMALVTTKNPGILREFLTLLISSKASYIKETCRGTTVPHVSPDAISNMSVRIPPMATQRRIVNLVASLDSYLEGLENELAASSASRNAVLYELSNVKGSDWSETTLGQISEVVGGGTPSTSEPAYWDGEIVWLTPTEVVPNAGKILTDSLRKISKAGLKHSGAKLLPKGSVILTSRASIGYAALSGVELCTNQGFQSLIPGASVLPEYLMYWIQMNRSEFESRSAGSTFKEISKSNVQSIKISLPPLEVQERIIETISEFDLMAERVQSLRDSAINLRAGLLSKLLSGEHEIPDSYDKLMDTE